MYFLFPGEISVPSVETNEQLKEEVKAKIRSGEINIGQLIVPKKYEKLILDDKNEIKKIEFFVEGRKMPLSEIRERTLQKHKRYHRSHPDEHYGNMTRIAASDRLQELNEFDDTQGLPAMREKLKGMERTRHLAVWHDHSSVANHGYLMFLACVLYDPAIHLTDKEYEEKYGEAIEVQKIVEEPEIYIVARKHFQHVE